MSVAIVSSSVKPPVHSTPADTPAEPASTGPGFASLLHGQLAAGAKLKIDAPLNPAEKADDAIVTAETSPQDAASMLAALGLTPPEPTRKTDTEKGVLLPDSASKDRPGSLTPLQTTSGASDLKIDARNDVSLPTPIAGDDKPARFAVPDAAPPKAELQAVNTLVSDAPDTPPVGGLSTLAANAPGNLDNVARNNEPNLKIETSVRDHSWASDFGQKIVWLAANDKQSAQLTLNPPHMGPIEISLNLNKDTANAFFASPNAEVRATIEAALPRLREMLAGVGIELGQANVGAESFRQQAGNDAARQGSPRWVGDNAILGGNVGRQLSGQTIAAQRGNGMVDTFA